MRLRSIAIGLFGLLVTVTGSVHARAMSLTQIADNLQVKYQVISNLDNEQCEALFKGDCFTAQLQFSLSGKQKTSGKQVTEPFQLYFSHIAPIKWDDHPELDIRHINGDLHQIAFSGNEFSQGQSQTITFKAAFWHAAHSDVMPNYFVVSESEGPFIVASTRPDPDSDTGLQVLPHLIPHESPAQWRRYEGDKLPLADTQWLYQRYASLNQQEKNDIDHQAQDFRIIPRIKHSQWQQGESVSLTAGVNILWGQFTENQLLVDLLAKAGVAATKNGLTININQLATLAPEAYSIKVEADSMTISAADTAGLQHAFVSLYQVLNLYGLELPTGSVKDAPRYSFRGVHADVSRNFMGKQAILRLLEQMFHLKLNKLHFHLADDEGWRLQIPGLPELTEIGGFRCFDPLEDTCLLPQLGSGPHRNSPVNGYLTVADYQEILQFAHERHIEVIPSFDLPGHARAAVKAMEARYRKYQKQEKQAAAEEFLLSDFDDTTHYSSVQFYNDNTVNPCMDSTYHFIDTVIGKVKQMHAEVNAPLTTYHIGADETAGAWVESPVCQQLIASDENLSSVSDLKPMFLTRLVNIVAKHGLKAAGWSDGMHKVIDSQAEQAHQVNVWDTLYWDGDKLVSEFSDKGWKTVLSNPDVLYFDFPYVNHPQETGYYWASKNTDSFKVFQFMPDNLAANATQWVDRMGNSYTAQNSASQPEIAGVQSQIWTEAIRNPATFEYLMYPRLQVFAERAWHQADWEIEFKPHQEFSFGPQPEQFDAQRNDWQDFRTTLAGYMANSGLFSGNYRVPPPGIADTATGIQVNTLWPALEVQCRTSADDWFTVKDVLTIKDDIRRISCRSVQPENGSHSRTVTLNLSH